MQKRTMINRINAIIKEYGSFSIGELEHIDCSPSVGQLGNFLGLAEEFNIGKASISVFETNSFSSDPISEYDMNYIEMEKYVVEDILRLSEYWEAECLQTEKRISN